DLPEPSLPPAPARPYLGRPVLARDRVRFVGEPIAVVIAESAAEAVDAAELVEVTLEDLPAVVESLAAIEPGAPLLFPEHGQNVVADWAGEAEGDVLADAEVVVRARFYNQRVAAAPLEPGGFLAVPGEGDHSLTVWASTQAPFRIRNDLHQFLGLPIEQVRAIAPAVGGGFGAKGGTYPEHLVVAATACRLNRPVRWAESRSENLVSMTQGRGQVQDVELGARRDGTIVGLRARTLSEAGAYPWRGVLSARTSRIMGSGPYRIPLIDLRTMVTVTNTTPVGPYRGAGRPEATAMLERAMDLLAAELEMDPIELRRKNLLRPGDFPYQTPTGASYDSGDYHKALEEAVAMVGYDAVRAEQQARRSAGDPVSLGVGVSCFCEISGGGPEYGAVRIEPDGQVLVLSGSSPHGQGHETTLAQVAATTLAVPLEAVRVVHSDTGVVARGTGTFGSRSLQLAGSAVHRSATEVFDQARQLAAELLEAAPDDIVAVEPGRLSVAGVPSRAVSWEDVAKAAADHEVELFAEDDFSQEGGTYPSGTHIAVVEVDTETGQVHLRRLVAVDDCGTVVNPIIVAGQIHGGLAQGVAQALYEAVAYDAGGVPLTATLADYLVPSAADLPSWELGEAVTPSPRNPLGAKGIGESGTVGATPAVQNAVLDALSPFGVRHLDPPFSPERVWQAIRDAAGAAPSTR
ncbi:MAG: xanthine dehydrogenase family protein, partial [Acidimicrobiaceae bacterium]|nr:xanthine dehydrogenase family protein [Acidimicrobiaceae bacterium]